MLDEVAQCLNTSGTSPAKSAGCGVYEARQVPPCRIANKNDPLAHTPSAPTTYEMKSWKLSYAVFPRLSNTWLPDIWVRRIAAASRTISSEEQHYLVRRKK